MLKLFFLLFFSASALCSEITPKIPIKTAKSWSPMDGSKDVSIVNFKGKKALRMIVNFASTKIDRASWDCNTKISLTMCKGIDILFYSNDISNVSQFTTYFHSGNGWYRGNFTPSETQTWTHARIYKDKTSIEGNPAGWSNIDKIRISAWRGKNKDSVFFISDIGLFGTDADVAILRADSGTASTQRIINKYTDGMTSLIQETGLNYFVVKNNEFKSSSFKAIGILILPYNPKIPEKTGKEIARFLKAGGKLLACFKIPENLTKIVGIKTGPKGRPVNKSAMVKSDNCIYLSKLPATGGMENRAMFLLSILGKLKPRLWKKAAEHSINQITRIGNFRNFESLKRNIVKTAGGKKAALQALTKADKAYKNSLALFSEKQYSKTIQTAGNARKLMIEAFCRAQHNYNQSGARNNQGGARNNQGGGAGNNQSGAGNNKASGAGNKPGGGKDRKREHRAFWCHSAFGVQGMDWDEAIKRLADNGFTAIMPNMLWGGAAFYKSKVLPVSKKVAEQGDQIALCLKACKRYGIECHVWKVNFNMGWATDRAFIEKMKKASRTQVNYDGTSNERWLCPSNPKNLSLETEAMLEIVRNYDVNGIHFDYIRYPGSNCCFCEGCRKRFEKTINKKIKDWPADVRNNEDLKNKWLSFRRNQITALVKAVSEGARKIRKNIKISAAVFRNWPMDRDTVGQDWKKWCELGYLDFVCPMDYTYDSNQFERMIKNQLEWTAGVPCYPGIGLTVWSNPHDICRLIEQIKITRKFKTGGFTIFNYGPSEAKEMLPQLGLGLTEKIPESGKNK